MAHYHKYLRSVNDKLTTYLTTIFCDKPSRVSRVVLNYMGRIVGPTELKYSAYFCRKGMRSGYKILSRFIPNLIHVWSSYLMVKGPN